MYFFLLTLIFLQLFSPKLVWAAPHSFNPADIVARDLCRSDRECAHGNPPFMHEPRGAFSTNGYQLPPVGKVHIESPHDHAVSSMGSSSNWVIFSCDPSSDGPQEVLAYCSTPMSVENSGCGHVMVGGAPNTIIELPEECGKGPYARIVNLEVAPNQVSVPPQHQRTKPADEPVYVLHFDYEFHRIPESHAPIHMMIDVANSDNFWDIAVKSPPERKRWFEERGLMSAPAPRDAAFDAHPEGSHEFHWSDAMTIYKGQMQCTGPPAYHAALDIDLNGTVDFSVEYGFHLQGSIIPPSIDSVYLHFASSAHAQAEFSLAGAAGVSYDSSMVELASVGLPGLSFPGLLVLGPNLALNGYLEGRLDMAGHYKTAVEYTLPPVNITIDPSNEGTTVQNAPAVRGAESNAPLSQNTDYNVKMQGEVSLHLVPQMQLGVSLLSGHLVDAQVFVRADVYGGVKVNASLASASGPDETGDDHFCMNPYFGIKGQAGITGKLAFLQPKPLSRTFYADRYWATEQCFGNQGPTPSLPALPVNESSLTSTEGVPVLKPEIALAQRSESLTDVPFLALDTATVGRLPLLPFPGDLLCPVPGIVLNSLTSASEAILMAAPPAPASDKGEEEAKGGSSDATPMVSPEQSEKEWTGGSSDATPLISEETEKGWTGNSSDSICEDQNCLAAV